MQMQIVLQNQMQLIWLKLCAQEMRSSRGNIEIADHNSSQPAANRSVLRATNSKPHPIEPASDNLHR